MDLTTLLAIGGAFLATISIMISFFLHLGSKIDGINNSLRAEVLGLRGEISSEMKDFHGRLCMIEATRASNK